jgi:hypothetical protein
MEPAHEAIFRKLCEQYDVIVVTGGKLAQIQKQIPSSVHGQYYSLSQSGNHAVMKDGSVLWSEEFSDEQRAAIHRLIQVFRDELRIPVKDENDLVEDRGSQISYSLIGHHEDIEKKEAFDPDAKKRLALLIEHKNEVEKLLAAGADVRTGGTTTFDFTLKGKHKGFNVGRFIEKMGWKKEECIYVGDALFPGGNDETVVGVIPTKAVNDYHETYEYLASVLSS